MSEKRKIVIPGEDLGNVKAGEGCFEDGGKVLSGYLGVTSESKGVMNVIPIGGKYMPQIGDSIVGIVAETQFSFWVVDLNSPYDSILPVSEAVRDFVDIAREDISKYFKVGDLVYAVITNVTKSGNVKLSLRDTGYRKLMGGSLVKVSPSRVPRLIGRSGSMVEMIKETANCKVTIGQNGLVWIKGATPEDEKFAIGIVNKISEEFYREGLTDIIKEELEKRGKK